MNSNIRTSVEGGYGIPCHLGQQYSDNMNDEEDFPNTLEGFGYRFNEFGQLRHIETGKPFQFQDRKDDSDYNQRRYETVGELVTEHVYELLETEGKLKKEYIPVDATANEFQTFIFLSNDALTNPDKLLLLIHGNGVVRAGQWSRRLIINECLNSGSQLPFIKRAQGLGYGVIVLNTNDNYRETNNTEVYIRGSENSDKHAFCVWENFVRKAAAKHVGIIAHSYGGIVTLNMAQYFGSEFQDRVFAIALTDSVHSLKHQRIQPTMVQWLQQVARNWVSSDKPLDTVLSSEDRFEVPFVSAGHERHEMTSWSSFASIFEFLDSKYQASIAEHLNYSQYGASSDEL